MPTAKMACNWIKIILNTQNQTPGNFGEVAGNCGASLKVSDAVFTDTEGQASASGLQVINVFPNPLEANTPLYVNLSGEMSGSLHYVLMDRFGQVMSEGDRKADAKQTELAIGLTPNQLLPGIYYLQISGEGLKPKVIPLLVK
ncbi:MAG: hypothetical protein HC880_21835 [Bacteroidia bacterium]|nr:hypothetical protein [Bacteroidia bacterium]